MSTTWSRSWTTHAVPKLSDVWELQQWDPDCHLRNLHLGNSHDLHKRDIKHLVQEQLGNLYGHPNKTMKIGLCTTTGMLMTGKSAVFSILNHRAPVVVHNGRRFSQ